MRRRKKKRGGEKNKHRTIERRWGQETDRVGGGRVIIGVRREVADGLNGARKKKKKQWKSVNNSQNDAKNIRPVSRVGHRGESVSKEAMLSLFSFFLLSTYVE